jgi:hypothetical protein
MSDLMEIPVEQYRGYVLMVFDTKVVIRSRFEGAYVAAVGSLEEAYALIDKWLGDEIES